MVINYIIYVNLFNHDNWRYKMKIGIIIFICLTLLFYAFLSFRAKNSDAKTTKNMFKIACILIIFILTLLNKEYLEVFSLVFDMRISLAMLTGIELIDAINQQVLLDKNPKKIS